MFGALFCARRLGRVDVDVTPLVAQRAMCSSRCAFILGGSGHPEEPYTWKSPVHQGNRSAD